ncbi:hypothetical protein OG777_13850 [Micromonospora peucetia]|uniref:Uncharacterized protein n=1 Tax=Micromonospora peucetia TaxID=47871 RepID=A0A1C6VVV6_9ACTN|nr:hypothetical protein [Micromonospora peucetia]MCX4388012.1 hypothetical protein [Micromonospora peucetia]SCL70362.1 hypothetical protein GA0070608_4313 [Micromonospora peucetia]
MTELSHFGSAARESATSASSRARAYSTEGGLVTVLKPGTRRSLAVDDIGKAAAAAIIESDRFDEVEVGRGQEPVTQAGERVV